MYMHIVHPVLLAFECLHNHMLPRPAALTLPRHAQDSTMDSVYCRAADLNALMRDIADKIRATTRLLKAASSSSTLPLQSLAQSGGDSTGSCALARARVRL